MDTILPKYPRILAIAPATFGFGLAVVEDVNTLVGWDIKRVRRDRNNGCLLKIEKVIALYQPHVLVLEDASAKEIKRSARIRALMKRIITLAEKRGIRVAVLPRKKVRAAFFSEGLGTKDALAKLLAERFPEELARHLPPERTPWTSEDRRMAMFDAVALAVAFRRDG
jgi:hypothetical protein